ncbi:hypothetical protein HanIR_Chr16g0837581 [Helianthus annuus]|nr:hypothetical protein HanIR_Chr16g0837581 [Helianthus annuus]
MSSLSPPPLPTPLLSFHTVDWTHIVAALNKILRSLDRYMSFCLLSSGKNRRVRPFESWVFS